MALAEPLTYVANRRFTTCHVSGGWLRQASWLWWL